MKTLKLIATAVIAAAFTAPAFAGPDASQLAAQKRAYERFNARSAAAGGSAAPSHRLDRACNNRHPTERVRR